MTLILPNGRPIRRAAEDDTPSAINITFPVPWCPICGHEVDKFEAIDDPVSGKTTLVAYCHGDTDDLTVYSESLAALKVEMFNQPSRYVNKGRVTHKFFDKKEPKL